MKNIINLEEDVIDIESNPSLNKEKGIHINEPSRMQTGNSNFFNDSSYLSRYFSKHSFLRKESEANDSSIPYSITYDNKVFRSSDVNSKLMINLSSSNSLDSSNKSNLSFESNQVNKEDNINVFNNTIKNYNNHNDFIGNKTKRKYCKLKKFDTRKNMKQLTINNLFNKKFN
jgi:hypothetical protein